VKNLQSIITLIAIAIAILAMSGVINPYKKKYLAELKAVREQSEAREDSLKTVVFSLENEALRLQNRADSTLKALEGEETKRKKERDEFNKRMAELSKLSTTELARYFAERYSR
tara:strand:- start:1079 stop:1420 length:342 start_codon:yes stop_codon:yes gene_type:complete